MTNNEYWTDIVVVGAGAVGSAITRELMKYQLDVILVERFSDICGDASKSNNGTVCSGYDLTPDSLHAKLVIGGNQMLPQLAEELDFGYRRAGAIVVAFTPEDMQNLEKMYRNSRKVGLYDTELLTREKCLSLEPSLNPAILGGLLSPREMPVDVMQMLIAFVENAVYNGAHLMLSTPVTGLVIEDDYVKAVRTPRGLINTKYVINAAGVHADEIAKMAGVCNYRNYPRRGQVLVLDKDLSYAPSHIIQPCPNPLSRGKILTRTYHGNLICGPSAKNENDREDRATDTETLDEIIRDVKRLVPAIQKKDTITQYVGIRPTKTPVGWSINVSKVVHGYAEAIGITAGISAAPAIAAHIVDLLVDNGLCLVKNNNFNPYRKAIRRINKMSPTERDEAIRRDPAYGNIVCRCEMVSEAEIIQAIHRVPGARTLDGVKRHLRTGMGRCNGSFCSPRIVDILARELGVPIETIKKNEPGSEILVGKNR